MVEPDRHLAREQMLRTQLRRRGIVDRRVLAAMAKIPRERFVAGEIRGEAYADRALPIDYHQTISQPYIVALMSQALELAGEEKVLEVGTGSGYQTAILAELAREVFSVERYEGLSREAGVVLAALSYENVFLEVGDGTLGLPGEAPFDRIIVTAAASRCPPALYDQLAEDGIIVIPLGGREVQTLEAIRKTPAGPESEQLSGCRFVPLVGAQGWPDIAPEDW